MIIINKSNIKIIATLLIKNEEDIISKNIEHHINQGVSNFIITDNASSDKTRSIIEKYPEVVDIIDEHDNSHRQSEWVTRMARLACKYNPDWIVHIDGDELWCGLNNLRFIKDSYVSSTKMFLHPPTNSDFSLSNMKYYLNFENIPDLDGESKVAHRPDLDVTITFGNHGFTGNPKIHFTKKIWRHHYPIRSYKQFLNKIQGHKALQRRNSVLDRWKKWHDLNEKNELHNFYIKLCNSWESMIENPNKEDFLELLEFWSTKDVYEFFKKMNLCRLLGLFPKH